MAKKSDKRTGGEETGKLTLSVGPKYVAMLRKASARKGRSITELVKDLAVQLDQAGNEGDKELWADRMNGKGADAFSAMDYERKDLLGALLRKHLPLSKSRK
jgi:hypothetical protein